MAWQYKTTVDGSVVDVPSQALGHAGASGSLQLSYPVATERSGTGLPCAAVGKPRIELLTEYMTGTGMDWWQALFPDTTAESVQIWMSIWNARTGVWEWFTGYLTRPTWERSEPFESAARTLFYGVTVRVVECVQSGTYLLVDTATRLLADSGELIYTA